MRFTKWLSVPVFVVLMVLPRTGWAEGVQAKLGLQAGLSLATLSTPASVTAANITGFAAGIAVEAMFDDLIGIQPELNFVQRGSVLTSGGITDISARYSSLEIPIFLKLKFGTLIQPSLFAGPNFAFNFSQSLTGPNGTGGLTFNPKTVDFGFAFGGGVEFGPLYLNLRYVMGVVDLDQNTVSWQSRGFLAMVGLKL